MVWSTLADIGSTVADVGSDVVQGIGNVFSGGGAEAAQTLAGGPGAGSALNAYNAAQTGGSLAAAGNLFSSAANVAGNAFRWVGDNPDAANLIGGVAMGIGAQRSAQKDRDLQRELQRERLEAQKIVPGELSNYGSYNDSLTQGILSRGMIANDQEKV